MKMFVTLLIASALVTACGENNSVMSKAGRVPAEDRVKVAEENVGQTGATIYWKCVGKLDENVDRFLAVAFQHDFANGTVLMVNKLDFAAEAGGYKNETVLQQHVSSYVHKGASTIRVALPVTNEQFPENTPLVSYDAKNSQLTFLADVTGENIVSISCGDQLVTRK